MSIRLSPFVPITTHGDADEPRSGSAASNARLEVAAPPPSVRGFTDPPASPGGVDFGMLSPGARRPAAALAPETREILDGCMGLLAQRG